MPISKWLIVKKSESGGIWMADGLWPNLKLSPVLRNLDYHSEEWCHLIVEVSGNVWDKVAGFVESEQGTVSREIKLIPAMEIKLPAAAVSELARLPLVRRVWSNTVVKPLASSPNRLVTPWLPRERGTGKGVIVALLDTGIRLGPGLGYSDKSFIGWADIVNSRKTLYDDHGHGTRLARIIAEHAPDARLIGVKVLNRKALGTLADVLLGVEWCLDNSPEPIRVMVVPLKTLAQGNEERDPLCRALTLAKKEGVLVCTGLESSDEEGGPMAQSPGMNRRLLVAVNSEWPDNRSDGRLVVPNPDHPLYFGRTVDIGEAVGYISGIAACVLEKYPSVPLDWVKKAVAKEIQLQKSVEASGKKVSEPDVSEWVLKGMQALIDQVITYLSHVDVEKLVKRLEFYQNPQINEQLKLVIALMKVLKINEAWERMLRNSMIPELIKTGLKLLQESIEKARMELEKEMPSPLNNDLNLAGLMETIISGIRADGGSSNSDLQEIIMKLIRSLASPKLASE